MTARKQTNHKSKSPAARKRRPKRNQSNPLNFAKLEARQFLAAITVGNATDVLSPTADTSSIAALVANDGGDGISLREAIAAANNTVGEDAITFDSSVFTGSGNSLIRLTQGELSISDSLSIDGTSVRGVLITGDGNGDDITVEGTFVTDVAASSGGTAGGSNGLLDDNSRVLNFSGTGYLSLTSLTITGGRTIGVASHGGGIYSSGGNVSLSNSSVRGNSTIGIGANGGGIHTAAGNVSVTSSTVSGNSVAGQSAKGGGIYTDTGDVSLTSSAVSGNRVSGYAESGGGIFTDAGDVSLTSSSVGGNRSSRDGGGISTNSGNVSLVNSTVIDNRSGLNGGGIHAFNGNVSLTNSTVSDNSSGNQGGGIFASSGSVSLIDGTVRGNTTSGNNSFGGGISTHSANVSLVNSNVSGNSSTGGSSKGGGIYTQSADVSLTNSFVSENDSERDGGGIYIRFDGASVSLVDSSVSRNTSGRQGGGIRISSGDVVLSNSTVSENSSEGNGGGILLFFGSVVLTDSDVSNNSSGIYGFGGGIVAASGDVSLTNSTVSGNSSVSSVGGIAAQTVSLNNSTVSGNSSVGDGGGIVAEIVSLNNSTLSGNSSGGDGGGILSINFNPSVLVVNSTITDNSAAGTGGGIFFEDPDRGALTLHNSIVAGNADNGTAPDVIAVSDDDRLIVEHSLIGDTTGSGITATTGAGNILNQSALLGPLADNGGTTLTHALLSASPARDAGSDALALDENGDPLATDQRGEDRIQFGGVGTVDIGAVESQFEEAKRLIVTTSQDVEDPFDGVTSLREAIAFANDPTAGVSNDGDADGDGVVADAITFDANTFTGGDSSLIHLTQGELSISDSLSIDGSSAVDVVITGDVNGDDITLPGTYITDVSASFGESAGASGDLLDDNSRVLNFVGPTFGPVDGLTLTGLTITGGRAMGAFGNGGGVRFFSRGTLEINNSVVSGNSVIDRGAGGAIYSSAGDVLLINSTLSGNISDGNGGGIHTLTGELTLRDSTVSGNSTTGDASDGGGIYARDTVSLFDSSVSGNSATGDYGSGGGIRNYIGVLSLYNSVVNDNVSGLDGGGISLRSGTVSLEDSTVSGNRTTGFGADGGGIFFDGGSISLNNSTVSGNISGDDGGGIGTISGDISLSNSTVSGNSSGDNGGGIRTFRGDLSLSNSTVSGNVSGEDGGGIWSDNSAVLLVSSTVTSNSAAGVGGGIGLLADDVNSERLTLHNSIVTGNTDNGTAPDLLAVGDVLNDLVVEHSLIGDTTGSEISSASGRGNILNQLAQLGPLADNGGPTLTHAPLNLSPAIDGGSNVLAVDENGNRLTTDQRGENRVRGNVDIGAVEDPFLLGDVNLDEAVNFLDIVPFISMLTSSSFLNEADINRDGVVNFLDISPFVTLLSSGGSAVGKQFATATTSSVDLLIEEPFSTAAELFDAHPESLDEVFDFKIGDAFAGLID